MSIDRAELERLLADRPTGNRSAMQAVRESYADIGLMRERGLSWAEISDVLAKLGVTARDNQPISPVTLRSAFFLVGNEGRDGGADGEEERETTPRETLDAVHRAALAAGQPDAVEPDDTEDAAADPEAELVPALEPEPDADPEPAPEEVSPDPAPAPALPVTPLAEPAKSLDEPAPIPQEPILRVSTPQDSTTNTPWKGDRMLGTIFVLNDRGGVGKTLLSHHLMATAMLEGLQLKVVEYEVNERLNRLFGPEVVEHRRITQDFMNMMGSGDGFYEFWDQIGPELQRGGRLYDFGGNISQWFFNWAEVSGFDYYVGEGERLTFMVPVTVDLASLSTGMNTLERIATIAPKAKRVLVENGFSGPFSQLDDSQYARRKAEMVEREGVEVISMAPCTAPAWARLTGHRIDEVAQMTREDLVKLGMTPPVASRSLIIIHEWLRTMRQALSPYLRDAFNQSSGPAAKTGARQGAL
ncbi:hypothetical protein D9623_07600 [Azospirillum brasilense]|uniref:Uncharacterized protein n=2 Tax=Azospirillum brasilense TaxID=192 RepID=A0A0P0ESH3_AZOBR|nr:MULTISPECIES: hypothetical protein [Azospirillum]ALJ35108.1 hypothetical protein AMK58_06545 [Azospirillum brasilense]MDW7553606.1 hypothetical protein [Azospirillum brasilense]MDW7594187.1 hypothetical protein [Azospirillum brasilense]MDX5953797.1 hypothetical protein [Azospirillum brasilense]OPH17045.1 hypothetical protein FE89_01810 [Azospirillum brasilense]